MLLNFLSFMYLPFIILYRKAKSQSKMSKLHTYISSSGTIWYLHLLGYHISPWKNPPFHILQFVYQSAAMSNIKVLSNHFAFLIRQYKMTHRFSITIFSTLLDPLIFIGIVTAVGLLFSNITEHKVIETLKDFNRSCLVSLLEVNYINNFIWSLSSWTHQHCNRFWWTDEICQLKESGSSWVCYTCTKCIQNIVL